MVTILLTFLFGLFRLEPELDFADTLFQKGFYEGAINQYQRFIFYNFSSPSLPYARYQLALSYLKRNKGEDQLKGKRILWELANNFGEMVDSAIIKRARRSLISLLLAEKRIEEVCDFSFRFGDTTLRKKIKGIKGPKKEFLASLFSTFFPGLGEAYAGKPGEGLKAFLVNTLCLYGIYRSLKAKKKMDAILIFSFAFLRFYPGSIQNALRFAREYNESYFTKELIGSGLIPPADTP